MEEFLTLEKQTQIIFVLPSKEVSEMSDVDKEKYLNDLTVDQYESLEITGGDHITSSHDYRLKRYSKRREWVEKTIENSFDEYSLGMSMIPLDNRQFIDHKVPRALDMMGKYLLKSHDILSCRKLPEYTFYEDESEYAKRKIGEDTVVLDQQEAASAFENGEPLSTNHGFEERLNFLVGLLDISSMNHEEKRKLLSLGISQKDNSGSEIQHQMKEIYDDIISNLKKEDDKKIVDLIVEGKTETEIASIIGGSQPNVNKKIKRIVGHIGSWY